MKKYIIKKCMEYINKNTQYDNTKLKEIEYGLSSLYLTISKLFIIYILAFFLGIFKDVLFYMIIYNIIRMPSFGLHATKSWICLISSTIIFIGIPYLSIVIIIPTYLKIIIGILGICLMYKNAPADTEKRPIISTKRRKLYKFISTILAILFSILSLIIKNNFISNCLIISLILQNFMISPITYKIFKLPYNNYKVFLKTHPEYQQ